MERSSLAAFIVHVLRRVLSRHARPGRTPVPLFRIAGDRNRDAGLVYRVVGLGLNYAAYESQVYRAALEAIPLGQWEASYSLGMSPLLAFRRIILPQAFRIALPPMTNDFVSLFKDTSVAFAISVWELATAYRELANASGQFLLLGLAVSAFYLAMSLPMAHLARLLERRLRERTTERTDLAELEAVA